MTSETIELARDYWQNTIDFNPDAGIISTLKEFFEDRPENPTSKEIEQLSFKILF